MKLMYLHVVAPAAVRRYLNATARMTTAMQRPCPAGQSLLWRMIALKAVEWRHRAWKLQRVA